jgi:hypothetical protein
MARHLSRQTVAEALVPELAKRGIPFEGFCWCPCIDSTDWCSLCRRPSRAIDPQWVCYLDGTFNRRGSELSRLYVWLARGEIGSAHLPAYRSEEAVLDGRGVRKFVPHMAHREWRDGEPSGP